MTRFALDALPEEVRRVVANEGLRPFARRTGLAMGLVRSILDGRDISFSNMLIAARALDFEVAVQPKRFSSGFEEQKSQTNLSGRSALRAGFLPIPWHPELGFLGSAPVAFSGDWLTSEGLIPDYLQAVTVNNELFSSINTRNTVAILDTVAPKSGAGDLWCYKDNSEIRVSRIAFSELEAVILPDSPKEPARFVSRPFPTDFKLLGRVVWLGLLVRAEAASADGGARSGKNAS